MIAIDGPSGSGKSTTALGVAKSLGLEVLDTGAMYRAVTLAVIEADVDPADAADVARIAAAVEIETTGAVTTLNGRDVSLQIRGPDVTAAVSTVAAHPDVRSVLVEWQRRWVRQRGGGVVEGRDIGTVVFPDATVKVYLTASESERAERRRRDEEAASRPADAARVRESIARRDRLDSSRAAAPLRTASDAVLIDTTRLSVEEVVREIVRRYEHEVAQ